MIKKIFSLLALFLVGVLMSSVVLADVSIESVKIDGTTVSESSTNYILDVDRGDNINVKVTLKNLVDDSTDSLTLNDVQIEAVLRGIDSKESIDDITDTFDMKINVTYVKELTLPLIQKMNQDKYKLRIRISDRDSVTFEKTYELDIGTKRHDVEIRDVVLSPDNEVKAGRALLATVRVRNRGEKAEDGVKIVVSIPKLGVSATDFIDTLEKEGDKDDQATSEEMFLRIPDDAETGEYTVRVEAIFDDGDEKSAKETKIFVLGEESTPAASAPKPEDKTIITIAVDKQSVIKGGAESSYLIALTNAGSSSKTYTISADGANWVNLRVSPNVLVINSGDTKAFTVFASAKENAPAGSQIFTATISSGDKILKQLPLSLNVQEAAAGSSKLKRVLEVGLVVLVILLVIIGIIIGFSKLRGDEGEGEKGDEKTYY